MRKVSIKKNNILISFILFIIICIVLVVLYSTSQRGVGTSDTTSLQITTQQGQVGIEAEIADTEAKRRDGLMYRENLGKDSGMIFIFSDEQERVFWMKNTHIPLDIIFLDGSGVIIQIAYGARPDQTAQRYSSGEPAKYVIEVNAGWCQDNDIQLGDRLLLSSIDNSK